MANLHEEIQKRYLNYAMSVIMSRAIPDVRDGMKPVQRRILYAMWKDLKLLSSNKYRKNAAIVGTAMSTYHPHGDASIADALVRMGQDFSLRYTLVDGHGNYGSIDGDRAAAMRYIEARLTPLAERLLEELKEDTVNFRPNYDGTTEEPDVLPAQVPALLINGATGIAVGMATNIPPHNLKEVVDAACDLITNPSRKVSTLIKNHVRGPDFPTGGILLEDQEEIIEAYETGKGTFTIRARWEVEKVGRSEAIVITEIPYAVTKDTLIEKIADHVANDKVPQITDVRDESTDTIRIVLPLKKGASHEVALAYLFKHTDLESRFHMNLTCLVPTEGFDVPVPEQIDLKTALRAFVDFRFEVVTRRLTNKLKGLDARVHILEAFEKVFGSLQKVLELIQASTSKKEARSAVMKALNLDEGQAEAIISIPLYRLANTEKQGILDELESKRQEAERVRGFLNDEDARWEIVRSELREIGRAYGDERRTSVSEEVVDFTYNEEDFIESQDVYLIASRTGWVRTQKSYGDLDSLRCRDNDEIGWVLPADTKDSALFFTTAGKCYTMRVADLPLTTGYGDPIQSIFKWSDGEKLVNVVVLNDEASSDSDPEEVEMVSVSKSGYAVRFSLDGYEEPSTVVGRTYQRLDDGDQVVNCCQLRGSDYVVLATHHGRGTTFDATEVRVYKGAGKGVTAIKLEDKDGVLAYTLCGDNQENNLHVETNRGSERMLTHQTYKPTARGNKGYHIIKRGHLIRWHQQTIEIRRPE